MGPEAADIKGQVGLLGNMPDMMRIKDSAMKSRIQFVISNLGTGGAEMMLYKLLSRIDRNRFVPEITSLTDYVPLAEKFRTIEVPVRVLKMRRGVPDPRWVFRLSNVLGQHRPHLVQTWMYHADLIGGLAAKLSGRIPVIWNIRHSSLAPGSSKRTTRLTAKACARLSSCLPAKIICCAETAKRIHIDLGYDSSRMLVIPNGFDLGSFKPDPEAKKNLSRELGIPPGSIIIGLVARFHPEKNHETFIQAAALLKAKAPNVRFVLCGDGITWENKELTAWIEAAGLHDSFHLLGHRSDIPQLVASFDIATSSSLSEGFSNTIGEAMACAVPCVVTDVGDSASIVGKTGKVVLPQNPEALSTAWLELIDLERDGRQELGRLARQRILQHYSLDLIVKRYEELYSDIVNVECK